MIDQEGGRVQRLAPPVWAARPAPGTFRAMADVDPRRRRRRYLNAAVMAALAALGVDVNCVPDLDLAFPQAAPARLAIGPMVTTRRGSARGAVAEGAWPAALCR